MIDMLYEPFKKWSEKGSVYILSDTHFDDSDCKLMNPNWVSPDRQVEIINSIVHKNDTFICLGDVGDTSFIAKLKARHKVLIKGNHDAGSSRYKRREKPYDYDFPTEEDAIKALKSGAITRYEFDTCHAPFIKGYVDNHLFDEVYEGPLMIAPQILLSHEPIYGIPWCLNIHGHDHGGKAIHHDETVMIRNGNTETEEICHFMNLAANVCNYTPLSLGTIIKDGFLSGIPTIHRITINKAEKSPLKKTEKQCEYVSDEPARDLTRYLICPFSGRMHLITTSSKDAQAYCPDCDGVHGFSRMNTAMGGREYGKRNNTWVETW